jgi:hypothetical protein
MQKKPKPDATFRQLERARRLLDLGHHGKPWRWDWKPCFKSFTIFGMPSGDWRI